MRAFELIQPSSVGIIKSSRMVVTPGVVTGDLVTACDRRRNEDFRGGIPGSYVRLHKYWPHEEAFDSRGFLLSVARKSNWYCWGRHLERVVLKIVG